MKIDMRAPLFHISGTAGRIVLKFVGWLLVRDLYSSYAFYASYWLGISVRAHMHNLSPYLRS